MLYKANFKFLSSSSVSRSLLFFIYQTYTPCKTRLRLHKPAKQYMHATHRKKPTCLFLVLISRILLKNLKIYLSEIIGHKPGRDEAGERSSHSELRPTPQLSTIDPQCKNPNNPNDTKSTQQTDSLGNTQVDEQGPSE